MNITLKRTVSLSEPILPEALPAPLYEGESNAHTFIISATKNKEDQPLSGSVVAFFDRPDGTTVRVNGQTKDGKAYVTLTHECYAASGAFFLRVMLLNEETQVVIYSASGRMRKKADGESIDGGSTPGGGIVPPGGITEETDPTVPDWAKQPEKPTYTAEEVGALPATTKIPAKTSDLTNDSGFITQETDPTVPAWAKQPERPTYTAQEVGALPTSTKIPAKTSDLTNDSGFITQEADPTVPNWAKQPEKPAYTADEVGALPASTKIPSKTSDLTNDSGFITKAASDLANYYAKSESYTREEIDQKISAIPKFSIAVVDSLPSYGISETTVYLLKSGEGSDLYTEFINVNGTWEILGSQRVDLTGYATETWTLGKLAEYQPKGDYAQKSEIPTKLSQLSGDASNRTVTDAEKTAWNAKSNFSGDYKDLTGKPTIPTVPTNVSAFNNDAGYLVDEDIAGKLDVTELLNAINQALAQAKESGEFDGKDGKDGATFTPHVDANGNLSWTNNQGLSNPSAVNIKGEKGEPGKDAPQEAVLFVGQTLTDTQKAQARTNIGAISRNELNNAVDAMPDYVKNEAEGVISRIVAAQGTRTFTLAAITDMHYGNGNYTDGVKHACQALKYIDERIKLDAVAVLGDYTDGYPSTTLTDAMADYRAVNALLGDLRFTPNMRQMGNHDFYADNIPITRRLVQIYSDDVVWGNREGGYYYKDFADYKLRVICLNCNENNTMDTSTNNPTGNISITAAQAQWYADVLAEINTKDDAEGWQILVLSHQPLDWYDSQTGYALAYISDAYHEGASFSNSAVSCDFSGGKNAAKLICNIHGHLHNLLVDYVHKNNVANGVKSNVYRMCTPEACIGRANQYDGAWKEATSYPKTTNTAKDTSFVVYCIDLEAYTISAICYGAGYDRELIYHVAKNGYTNQIPISKDASGAIFGTNGIKGDTRLNSSGTETALTGTAVTGYIPIKLNDVVRFKNINYLPGVNSSGNYISLYTPGHAKIGSIKDTSMTNSFDYLFAERVLDDSGRLIQFRIADGSLDYGYMRVSAAGLGSTSIITINEEIT